MRVSIDQQHIALPKLYGAPAYARPPAPVSVSRRPFDPDLLPLQVDQTEEERRTASYPPAHVYGSNGSGRQVEPLAAGEGSTDGRLRPRPFSLRAIAGRLLGGDGA